MTTENTDPEVRLLGELAAVLDFGPKTNAKVIRAIERVAIACDGCEPEQIARALTWARNRAESEAEAAEREKAQREANRRAGRDSEPAGDGEGVPADAATAAG